QAQQEVQQLSTALEAARREVEAAGRDKRELLARLGQGKRETKAVEQKLQVLQERVDSLGQQAASHQRAAAVASRQCQVLEKRVKEQGAALQAAGEEVEAARQQLAAGVKAQERAAQAQAAQLAASLTSAACCALDAATLPVALVLGQSVEAVADLEQELANVQREVQAELQELQGEVQGLCRQVGEQVGQQLVAEARLVAAELKACEEQVRQQQALAAAELESRYKALLALDARLAGLGPEGLDGLNAELQALRTRVADADRLAAGQAALLADKEAARQDLAQQLQAQTGQVHRLSRTLTELQSELASTRAAAVAAASEAATTQRQTCRLVGGR
ncbi:hypothetical protein QJQ45_014864, partial [Haematococcus lacustris]